MASVRWWWQSIWWWWWGTIWWWWWGYDQKENNGFEKGSAIVFKYGGTGGRTICGLSVRFLKIKTKQLSRFDEDLVLEKSLECWSISALIGMKKIGNARSESSSGCGANCTAVQRWSSHGKWMVVFETLSKWIEGCQAGDNYKAKHDADSYRPLVFWSVLVAGSQKMLHEAAKRCLQHVFVSQFTTLLSDLKCQQRSNLPIYIKPHVRSELMISIGRGLWSNSIVRRHSIKPMQSIGSTNRNYDGESQRDLNEKMTERNVN